MLTEERYLLEHKVFKHEKFPEAAYKFFGVGTNEPFLRIAAKTNSGKIYTLHMDLSNFPEEIPAVYVTHMLKDHLGRDMNKPSRTLHTLSAKNNMTRICHYGSLSWTPMVSLFKIYVKCRLWLEAYEAHLVTGNSLDTYLIHQQ